LKSCKKFIFFESKSGINETFEGHYGPVTGLSFNQAPGPIDFSHVFLTTSFDWSVKLWNVKVFKEKSYLKAFINYLFLIGAWKAIIFI
jgi:WD40 repeat protein